MAMIARVGVVVVQMFHFCPYARHHPRGVINELRRLKVAFSVKQLNRFRALLEKPTMRVIGHERIYQLLALHGSVLH